MKMWFCLVLLFLSASVSNTQKLEGPMFSDHHIFLVTLDGFRWQELFKGADTSLINDHSVTSDNRRYTQKFGGVSEEERRKKLMPFFWDSIARNGQLYGNRKWKNYVNVANPYALSYPGYNELLSGKVDLSIYNNEAKLNSNASFLQELHARKEFSGKVAAFASWNMFPFILNEAKFPVFNAAGNAAEKSATQTDRSTFSNFVNYLKKKLPSVVLLGFSGTDDAGHARRYDQYLDQAHSADAMIASLWKLLQAHPHYAGKTTLIVTTDHGRGADSKMWSEHGLLVEGSSQTWMAIMGKAIVPAGEMKHANQFWAKDLKRLVYSLIGQK